MYSDIPVWTILLVALLSFCLGFEFGRVYTLLFNYLRREKERTLPPISSLDDAIKLYGEKELINYIERKGGSSPPLRGRRAGPSLT